MHIDAFTVTPAQQRSRHNSMQSRDTRPSFIFSGDYFVGRPSAPQTHRAPCATGMSFWAWFGSWFQ